MTESSIAIIEQLLEQDILKDCPEPTEVDGCYTWKISPELNLSIISHAPDNSKALIFLENGVEESVIVTAIIVPGGPHTVQLMNNMTVNTLTIQSETDVVEYFKGCIQNVDLISKK